MNTELQISRVEKCQEWLADGEAFSHDDSIDIMIDRLGQLSASLAFINGQMAAAKKVLNEKKVTAYHGLITSSVANANYFAPSLAKDFISAKCHEEQYNYDLCERVSRTIVHQIDAIRTAISAMKEELKATNYTGQP